MFVLLTLLCSILIGLFREDVTKTMEELNLGAKTGEEGDQEKPSGGGKKGRKGKKKDDDDWWVGECVSGVWLDMILLHREDVGDVTKETEESSEKAAKKDTEKTSGVGKKGKKKGDW